MPSYTAKHERRGEIDYLIIDGVSVALYRYAESGQLFVSINTEDATHRPDNDEDGNPTIFVGLNDAVLYDGEVEGA